MEGPKLVLTLAELRQSRGNDDQLRGFIVREFASLHGYGIRIELLLPLLEDVLKKVREQTNNMDNPDTVPSSANVLYVQVNLALTTCVLAGALGEHRNGVCLLHIGACFLQHLESWSYKVSGF